jgi:hypothetical protein
VSWEAREHPADSDRWEHDKNPLHDVSDPQPRTRWEARDYALVSFLAGFAGTMVALVAMLLLGMAA